MTKTLTTERLREIASSPSFSANPLSHEVKYMARELLANREAQPVAAVDLLDLLPVEWFEVLSQSPELCALLTPDVVQSMAATIVKLKTNG